MKLCGYKHNILLLYRWTWCPQIDFKYNKPNVSANSFANMMFQRRYFVACEIFLSTLVQAQQNIFNLLWCKIQYQDVFS